ncbi:MAG: BioY family transporter [Candidatus Infernicultor aquiphilus]|uniref:Biotin transporter n=1 Tax=Candidatus Infernicultor aquiphilus TaxID=1805029 RepID=A0A2M7PTG0_9BACT|nr:MAG: BioY family transporter [Candidatus Atribacteria bacterium CG17_big_fil_post_rev_8_21_14_2_50_34_11]PIY33567.1 MAG: BioY family transporter [Candidatus Atribacteria bacterium CG_4_10_14_3_um_filter_34_13]PJB57326.1 MAG: BioY family transporter [Candidatus Atribacteria bacterium CG_4_9_14_3_um_filter_33_16]
MKKMNIRQMTLVSLFAALTAVGAFISIPLYPVPLTLQNLFTLLAGMTLGSVLGGSSQIIYVLLGLIGLPVFADFKAGIGVLFGPTGGFLFGFIISSYIVGKAIELKKEKDIFYYFLAGGIGIIIIYISGITQLSLVTGIGIKKALMVGVFPFLPGDILKIIAASFIASKLKLVIPLR